LPQQLPHDPPLPRLQSVQNLNGYISQSSIAKRWRYAGTFSDYLLILPIFLESVPVKQFLQVAQLCRERAHCRSVSGVSMHHADGGCSRRRNFGNSLVHSTFLMYAPDGTNVYGSRGGG